MDKIHKTKRALSLFLKRLFDLLLAIPCLIFLSPLLALIATLIKRDSSGPVLFKQQRIGLNGQPFYMYKFRTMVVNAENIGLGFNIEKNDPRITSLGNFLRAWSLDELPQLLNILKGEMSFIGPRPTLQHQVNAYSDYQRKRLLMKPGITGWAQVNGRNNIPWEQRIDLDVWYVNNWSILLDMKIFLKTFFVILKRDSIYNQNGVSYDFHGDNNEKLKND